MTNSGRTALIMTLIILAEGSPLLVFVLLDRSTAILAKGLGFAGRGAPLSGWTMAATIAAVYAAASLGTLASIRARVFTVNWLKLLSVLFAFVTGFFEEWYFRKVLMDVARAHGLGSLSQILVSGVLFGAVHAVWGLFGGSLRSFFISMAFTGVLGLALGWLYILDGRVVAPCVWSHIAINLIIEPWLLLGVLELRARRPHLV